MTTVTISSEAVTGKPTGTTTSADAAVMGTPTAAICKYAGGPSLNPPPVALVRTFVRPVRGTHGSAGHLGPDGLLLPVVA